MKFSLILSALILVIGVANGLRQNRQITGLRDDHEALAKKASSLGISMAPDSPSDARATKRLREESIASTSGLTTELIEIAKEMELLEKAGKDPDAAFQKRTEDLMLRLIQLDGQQLKAVVAALRDEKSLSEESRGNMIGFSILLMGEDYPSAALALFSESSDLLAKNEMARHAVATSLARWAEQDPKAALDWITRNASVHPALATDEAKRNILEGAARTDPKLAFELLGKMNLEDASDAVRTVVSEAKTPEQRTAILEALRGHLAGMPDSMEREELMEESLEDMGRNLSGESFDSVSRWIEKSNLTPQEKAQFAGGMSYFNTKQDTGLWIDWMAANLPGEQLSENVDNLVGQWTQQDYLAAGRWLTGYPEGPAKQAAVSSYASTVAEYEPQTAVQWAMTLPDGPQRQETLASIYHNWPANDPDAAAAFAKEHGIEPEEN